MCLSGGCSRFFVVECIKCMDWAYVGKDGAGAQTKSGDWVYVGKDGAGAQTKSGDWAYVGKDGAGAQSKCEDWAPRGRKCCVDPILSLSLGPGRKKASLVPKIGV